MPGSLMPPAPRRAARSAARAGTLSAARAGTRSGTKRLWRRWLSFSAVTGAAAGVLWWLLAPGGAFYGDGADTGSWFPRDAALGMLLLLAGVLTAGAAIRGLRPAQSERAQSEPAQSEHAQTGALALVLAVGGLAGSVLAWRLGVFAGDLFRTPPLNLPSPSMVFSLRSGSVLLLWPLASVAVVFLWKLFTFGFRPDPGETVHTTAGTNG